MPASRSASGSGDKAGEKDTGSEPSFVTHEDLDKFRTELLDAVGKSGGGAGKKPAAKDDDDTGRSDRDIERGATATVKEAFDELQRQKDHDEHHRRLADAESAAKERRERREKREAPAQSRGLSRVFGWED